MRYRKTTGVRSSPAIIKGLMAYQKLSAGPLKNHRVPEGQRLALTCAPEPPLRVATG